MRPDAQVDTAVDPPLSRRRRRPWRSLLIPLGLIALGVGWFWLGQPLARKHQLQAACANADRVVLAYRTPPERTAKGDWTQGERVTCEILGGGKVRALLATIEPRASVPYQACMCSTVPVIEIVQNGTVCAKLTLHHDSALRWLGGKWTGDTRLTQASVRSLQAWIRHEGGAELSQLEAKLDTLWTQYKAAREAEYKAEGAAGTRPTEPQTATQS